MRELILMVGLPRSGKSTKAMQASKGLNAPVCNPDSIRFALHGRAFVHEAEQFVWAIAHNMVRSWFIQGYKTVILDATNTTKARRAEWRREADKFIFYVIKTPLMECLQRAGNNDDMKSVIQRMYHQYEPVEPYEGTIVEW